MAPASSSGEAIERWAASTVRCSPRGSCRAHDGITHARHRWPSHSAKSRLMMPGMVMMSEMPCTPWRRISSAMPERFEEAGVLRDRKQLFVRDDDGRIDRLHQFGKCRAQPAVCGVCLRRRMAW